MTTAKGLRLPTPETDRESIRDAYRAFRAMPGVSPSARLLTDVDGSAKAEHSLERGDLVTMLYLAPARVSGAINTCPYSTPGCRKGCLYTAGRASFTPGVNRARVARTAFMMAHPAEFSTVLAAEIRAKVRKHGSTLGVRLNGTSDIPWETAAPWLFEMFADVTFYDYTKWPTGSRVLPANYDLTYSVSERPVELTTRDRFAVVFDTARGQALPESWQGFTVIDGDLSDARFAEPVGVVIGLRAKGDLRGDRSGMVKQGSK